MKAQPSRQGTKNTPAIPQGSRTQEQSSTSTAVPKKPVQHPTRKRHAYFNVYLSLTLASLG